MATGAGEVSDHLRALSILHGTIRREQPAVIIQQTLLFPAYLPFFYPVQVPRIVTLWNGDVTWYAKNTGAERHFKRNLVEWNLRHAAAVTVGSEHARAGALAHSAPPQRTRVMPYPGVDLEHFTPALSRDLARAEARLPRQRRIVLAPRGLAPYQHPEDVVRALASVPGNPLLVMLHESYDDLAPLQTLAKSLGVDVEFRIKGSHDAMPVLLRSADVVVSYSAHDSLPNTALEAMACGVSLVVGETPALRELVGGSPVPCVPLHDPGALGQALTRVLDHPLGVEDGLAVARRFDQRVLSERFRQLVVDVAGRR